MPLVDNGPLTPALSHDGERVLSGVLLVYGPSTPVDCYTRCDRQTSDDSSMLHNLRDWTVRRVRTSLRGWCPQARSVVTWLTLVAFVAGNIGWSAPQRLAAAGSCCCGHQSGKCKCSCCQPKPRACCQKLAQKSRSAARSEPAPVHPTLSCPCNGAPSAEFALVVQPKLTTPPLTVVGAEVSGHLCLTPSDDASHVRPRPATPPPRSPLA
jgi:hypothetical protein